VCDDAGTNRLGIADYAARVGADLTVLGTRGKTNLRDILLGSTAERVLAESRCSVLAVKPAGFHHPLAAGA
jgi:nucleotide-binding universal stress UspA family protein